MSASQTQELQHAHPRLALACLGGSLALVRQSDPFTTCPDPGLIRQCTCEKECDRCNATFVCNDLTSQTQLDEVLERSGDFPFRVAKFENCALQFVPHRVFEAKKIRQLDIRDSNMLTLLDEGAETDVPLQSVWLQNIRFRRGFRFTAFTVMKDLIDMYVEDIEVKKIPDQLEQFISPSVIDLEFINTKTLKIGDNAFAKLTKLRALVVTQTNVKTVAGSMFPPSLQFLDLSENKIKEIPDGFAEGMPLVIKILLNGNQIKFVKEEAVGTSHPTLETIVLTDNPLVCDCKIKWTLTRKKPEIEGHCQNLDKNVKDLTKNDLSYCDL